MIGMKSLTQRRLQYICGLILFALMLFVRFYDSFLSSYNSTILAFSYKYGFISRGLLGTIYQFVDAILPFDMMQYIWALRFSQALLLFFYIFFVFFCWFILRKVKDENMNQTMFLLILLTSFVVPTFCSEWNMGRLDMYCLLFSMISVMFLVVGKAEWSLIIFSGLGVMLHQGNVFMYLGIILILLLYRGMSATGKEKKKYLILFGCSFCVASFLFIWFQFFSHVDGNLIYDEIVSDAKKLSFEEDYHNALIRAEILGEDLTSEEATFRLINRVEFPIFLLCFSPYIWLLGNVFKNVLQKSVGLLEKCKYILLLVGVGTILPDMLLKVDYGRWMLVIISYYVIVMLALLAMGDTIMEESVKEIGDRLNNKGPLTWFLIGYPLLLQPLQHTWICEFTKGIAEFLNNNLLHLW